MRLFIGVRVPERLVPPLTAYVRRLAAMPQLPGMRPTAVANLHFTLKFIGEVPPGRVRDVAAAFAEAAGELALGRGRGEIRLERVTAFPPRGPRVVALEPDAAGAALLSHDHAVVEAALREAGVPPEGRAFRAHLTVGRFRLPPRRLDLSDAPAPPPEPFDEPAELIASDLRPAGPVYTTLLRAGEGIGRLRVPVSNPARPG